MTQRSQCRFLLRLELFPIWLIEHNFTYKQRRIFLDFLDVNFWRLADVIDVEKKRLPMSHKLIDHNGRPFLDDFTAFAEHLEHFLIEFT